jgi:hypothetical protein
MILLGMCFAFLMVVSAEAHIPMSPVPGTSLETAVEIVDPWKSWFYYSTLDVDEPHYYKFEAETGERVRLMLNIPLPEGDRGFNPVMALMGPGLTSNGSLPGFVEVPPGAGVLILQPESLIPEYEGFTPLSQYITVDLNISAPGTGTFYVSVYSESEAGRYALVTGYVEAYDLVQWITVPFMAITILEWSGQSILLILLPMLLPLVIGLLIIFRRRPSLFSREEVPALLGTTAALLFLGSGFSFFVQMAYALVGAPPNWTIAATFIFGSIPLVLGLAALRLVRTANAPFKTRTKATIVVVGVIALFTWAGMVLGPAMLIVAALLPTPEASASA